MSLHSDQQTIHPQIVQPCEAKGNMNVKQPSKKFPDDLKEKVTFHDFLICFVNVVCCRMK